MKTRSWQIILTPKPILVAEVQVIWGHRTSIQVANQIPFVRLEMKRQEQIFAIIHRYSKDNFFLGQENLNCPFTQHSTSRSVRPIFVSKNLSRAVDLLLSGCLHDEKFTLFLGWSYLLARMIHPIRIILARESTQRRKNMALGWSATRIILVVCVC